MRKSLVLWILLLVLAAAALAVGHGAVSAMSDDVVISETTLYGDPAAAHGLTVSLHTNYERHLFWRTVYAAGPETAPETEFSFSAAELYDTRPAEDDVWLMTGSVNFGIGGSDLSDTDLYGSAWGIDGQGIPLMQRPALDVAKRTAAGETHTETVRLRDYYQYYTVGMEMQTEATFGRWADLDQADSKALSEYFRFPVEEDLLMEVTVSRDTAGAVYDVDCRAVDGESGVQAYGIVTERGFYLYLYTPRDEEKGLPSYDFSKVAGGYGVYFIPIDVTETDLDVRTDRIQNIYPLDPAKAQTVCLEESQDGAQLLLFTLEKDRLVLTVLDQETWEPLQRLPLPTGMCPEVHQIEDLLILLNWDAEPRILVLTREKGVYDLWLDAPALSQREEERQYINDPQFAFDGSRLAMAGFMDYGVSPSLRLLTYDRTGLTYVGHYAHNASGSLLRMGTEWPDALTLSWAE